MILTGKEIRRNIKNGKIHIQPFVDSQLNPNSYNYRLDFNLFELLDNPIDPKKSPQWRKLDFPEEGFILEPYKVYLANTYEEIGSDYFVTSLIGRSSLGRLGLFLQITADLGNIGAKHCWTLELKCVQPIKIYPCMPIGQVSFWKTYGKRKNLYQGKYGNYSSAHFSEFYQEFTDSTR